MNSSFIDAVSQSPALQFLQNHPYIAAVLAVWSLIWKGYALWNAARLSHRNWFIAIMIVNTFGILEIVYIYFIARKYHVETEESVVELK